MADHDGDGDADLPAAAAAAQPSATHPPQPSLASPSLAAPSHALRRNGTHVPRPVVADADLADDRSPSPPQARMRPAPHERARAPPPPEADGILTPRARRLLARYGYWTLCCAVLLLAAGVVYTNWGLLRVWHRVGGMRKPVVFALRTMQPQHMCLEVSVDEIRAGTAQDGLADLADLRATLLYHIGDTTRSRARPAHSGNVLSVADLPLQGICAVFLERHPLCYCIVNMVRNATDPQNLVEMFNMRIIGISPGDTVLSTESSVLCQHTREQRRYSRVTLEWLDAEGVPRERDAVGQQAQTVQQLDDVQRGQGSCIDSNVEARLDQLIGRLDRNQAMLRGPSDFVAQLPARAADEAQRAAREAQGRLPAGPRRG